MNNLIVQLIQKLEKKYEIQYIPEGFFTPKEESISIAEILQNCTATRYPSVIKSLKQKFQSPRFRDKNFQSPNSIKLTLDAVNIALK